MKQDKATIVFNKLAAFTKVYGNITTAHLLEMARNIPDPRRSKYMVRKLIKQYPELEVFKTFTGKALPGTIYSKAKGIEAVLK